MNKVKKAQGSSQEILLSLQSTGLTLEAGSFSAPSPVQNSNELVSTLRKGVFERTLRERIESDVELHNRIEVELTKP